MNVPDMYNPKGFKAGDVITPQAGCSFGGGITYGGEYVVTCVERGIKFLDDDGEPRDRGDGDNFNLVSRAVEDGILTVEQLKRLEVGDKLYVVDGGIEKTHLKDKEVLVIGIYNREAGDFGFDFSYDGIGYFSNTVGNSYLENFKAKIVPKTVEKSMNTKQAELAPDFLQAALSHMKERAITYDNPQGERSMKATVEAFKAITGIELTEERGWLLMAILKLVRSQQGEYKPDSYEDGAAYFALMGEAANKARNNG